MAAPQMFIRVAANLDEFKKNLAEGKAQIEALTAGMNKIVASLQGDKLIQQAGNMAAAIREVGGVTKLTAAEMERAHSVFSRAAEKMEAMGHAGAASMRQLAEETKKQDPPAQSWISRLTDISNLFRGLLALGVVQWLKNTALGALEYASSLEKAKTSLDLTGHGFQQLETLAVASNVSVEALTSGLLDLEKRLATGDQSAAGALRKLKIDSEEFFRLTADQKFLAIARALQDVQSNTEKVGIASQLFRNYKEILPALKEDIDGLKGAVHELSDDTIAETARIERGWSLLLLNLRRYAVEAAAVGGDIVRGYSLVTGRTVGLAGSVVEQAARDRATVSGLSPGAPSIFGNTQAPPPGMGEAELKTAYRDLNATLTENRQKTKEAEEAAKRLREEWDRNADAAKKVELSIRPLNASLGPMFESGIEPAVELRLRVIDLERSATVGIGNIAQTADQLVTSLQAANPVARTLGDSFKSLFSGDFGQVFKDTGNFFKTGLKDIGKGFMQGIGTNILNAGVGLAMKGVSKLGEVLGIVDSEADRVGKQRGADIRKLAGDVGNLATLVHAATGETALLDAMLNADTEEAYSQALQNVNQALADMRQRLEDLRSTTQDVTGRMSGLTTITPDLQAALDTVYNAQTPQEYADAIARVNSEVNAQLQKQQDLDDAVKRLGLSWENLGEAARIAKLGEWATDVQKDIDLVTEAGADLNLTISKAAPELNQIVQAAIRSKTQIPDALKPSLEKAAELGLLFDDAGGKIDLARLNALPFGSTFKDEGEKVQTAMDLVVAALDRIITRLDTLDGKEIDYTINETVRSRGPREDAGTASGYAEDEPGYASGTQGQFLDFGSGTRVTLHGRERVMTEEEGRAEATRVSDLGKAFDRLESRMAARDRALPHHITIAVRDAIVLRRVA